MSRSNVNRVFVGNLPLNCDEGEVSREFEQYGKITRIDMKKTPSGNQFAFIEYSDSRDADDAIKEKDGYDFKGSHLRVEIPFKDRDDKGGFRSTRGRGGPPQRGKYVLEVSGLPPTGSWQDLKDHLRDAGQCGHADTFGDGTGEITFFSRSDLEFAIDNFNGSTFRSHEGQKSRITLREKPNEYNRNGRYSRSRSRSRSYDGRRSRDRHIRHYRDESHRDKYRRKYRSESRSSSRSYSRSRSRSRSRSPSYRKTKKRHPSKSASSSKSR